MPGLPHIDITPAGWDKAQAGDWLADLLGLSPEEVCCFGDADNDVALLGRYPNSVAVANATRKASRAARWHVGPACRDSVADALLEIAEAARTGDMASAEAAKAGFETIKEIGASSGSGETVPAKIGREHV